MRCRASHTAGQAMVEMALTFPVLVILLVGAAELARVAYSAIEASNAAHAGAQYASQSGYTATDTTGISNAAAADAANLSGLSTTSSITCACSDGTASACLNTDCANSHTEETVTVNTQATINPNFHIPGLPTTYTVHGQAVQRCYQ